MNAIIEKTLELLNTNDKWQKRYEEYLKEIWSNSCKMKKGFRSPQGLSVYTTIRDRNTKIYYLRFMGQNVGQVNVYRNGEIKLQCKVNESESHGIKDCPLTLDAKVDWDSADASKFRKFFKDPKLNPRVKS